MSFLGYALMVSAVAVFALGHQILVEEMKWNTMQRTQEQFLGSAIYGHHSQNPIPEIIITDCCKGEIVVEDK